MTNHTTPELTENQIDAIMELFNYYRGHRHYVYLERNRGAVYAGSDYIGRMNHDGIIVMSGRYDGKNGTIDSDGTVNILNPQPQVRRY